MAVTVKHVQTPIKLGNDPIFGVSALSFCLEWKLKVVLKNAPILRQKPFDRFEAFTTIFMAVLLPVHYLTLLV